MKGSVYKRCACEPEYDQRGGRKACKRAHGSWYYVVDLSGGGQRRRQVKKGGFPTKAEAESALAVVAGQVGNGTYAHDERQRLCDYLERWLDAKVADGLRPTTARSYRQHIDTYIAPAVGHLRLRDLRPTHVESMLREMRSPAQTQRPPSAATARRVHATLRSALASAKRQRLVSMNAAEDVELPRARRPKVRPWEASELGQFLDFVATDEMGALFELIAATGLRRGEAIGLRWSDIDLHHARLVVRQQVIQIAGQLSEPCLSCSEAHRGLAFGPPKTDSGEGRIVDLDERTVGLLLEHRLRQDQERASGGSAYLEHNLVFARQNGVPLQPDRVTKRFTALTREAGLRRIRLHDLRHGQASLMLAAGIPIAVVSKRLGHSSISLTSDTYSHLLEGVGRDAAERAAQLVSCVIN